MLKKYLTIALRKLSRKKSTSTAQLLSLSIAVVSLFYIGLYLHKEFSFDDFHQSKSIIYRLNTTIKSPSGDIDLALTATPLGAYLKGNHAEIEDFIRINQAYGSHTIRYAGQFYSESENIYYVDQNFLHHFDFEILSGNKATALQGPDKIMISRNMAQKYFGHLDVINKLLVFDEETFTITGVLENIPVNSQLQFDFLISMDTFLKSRPNANDNWSWFPMITYLVIDPQANITSLTENLLSIPQYLPENSPSESFIVSMEPMEGIHFSEARLGEPGEKGNLSNLNVLMLIGIMILILAVSNYINMSLAQTATETKQVSVKKTLGASRIQIFMQFFMDAFLHAIIASTISFAIILISFPFVEQFLGHQFEVTILNTPKSWLLFTSVPLLLSALSGIYPALRFSNVSPIAVFRNKLESHSAFSLRSVLLTFQFVITSALIVSSLIIFNQLSFLRHKELGMTIDQMLVVDFGPNNDINKNFETLKSEFSNIAGVESISFSSHIPGQIPNGVYTKVIDAEGQERSAEISLNLIDYDFIESYGITLLAGRNFRPERFASDTTSKLIINEEAMKAFGYDKPEDVIGARFEQWGGNGTIIGVVKNFNYLSLHNDVGQLSLKLWPQQFQKMSIKLSTSDLSTTLESVERKWKALHPNSPFNYYFADDSFNKQYLKDQQFADIIAIFTSISLLIGIIGLVAFANFWCEIRKKEISIRKVLGAEPVRLIWNFYKQFSQPIIISFVIGTPLAVYFSNQWLQQFAYHISISWYYFVIPLVGLMIITASAVIYQSLKVVLANPIEHLSDE